jgi:hypothetical protein
MICISDMGLKCESKGGKRHGLGKYTMNDGFWCIGQWTDERFSEFGKYTWLEDRLLQRAGEGQQHTWGLTCGGMVGGTLGSYYYGQKF